MTTTPFMFFHGETRLARRIHRNTIDLTERQPAVVVSGSWLTVMDQMADRSAAALAERGSTAFHVRRPRLRGQRGPPRQLELPTRKISDVATVVGAFSTLSFVWPARLGTWRSAPARGMRWR